MNLQNEVIRAVIRGLGFRVTRGLPWWVAVLALALFYLWGHK